MIGAFLKLGVALFAMPLMAGEGGLPQLNPSYFLPQIAWVAVTFLVVFLLVKGKAIPQIDASLQKRRTIIADAIAKGEEANAKAIEVSKKSMDVLQKASDKSRDIAKKSLQETAEKVKELTDASDSSMGESLKSFNTNLSSSRKKLEKEAPKVTEAVSIALVQKLTGNAISDKIVIEALKTRGEA